MTKYRFEFFRGDGPFYPIRRVKRTQHLGKTAPLLRLQIKCNHRLIQRNFITNGPLFEPDIQMGHFFEPGIQMGHLFESGIQMGHFFEQGIQMGHFFESGIQMGVYFKRFGIHMGSLFHDFRYTYGSTF